MAFDNNGKWSFEDDSVANKVAAITAGSSDYMRQAKTNGLQVANRRGLGNSSMAVGAAQASAIDRATPIASQEASQIAGYNLGEQNHLNTFDRDRAGYAAGQQEMLATALTNLSNQRFGAYATIAQNPEIPADARNATFSSINSQYDDTLRYLQDLYQVNLRPAGTTVPAAGVPAISNLSVGGLG